MDGFSEELSATVGAVLLTVRVPVPFEAALKFESPEWTEFLTGATTLALHGGGVKQERRGGADKDAGTCSLGFNVDDVDKTYEEMKGRGVSFVMPPTQREGEGIKLAVAVDPDGLPISFAQLMK